MTSKKNRPQRARPAAATPTPGGHPTQTAAVGGPVRIRATAEALDEEREVLFVIERETLDDDGHPVLDDEGGPQLAEDEYTIPRKVRPNFAVKFLNDVYRSGDLVAVAGAMHSLLGAETMDALAESPYINDEHMEQIMAAIQQKMAGAANRLMGNF
jgi:hypothetical protein